MKPLEIYVHIPFCIRKCAYCDFYSHASLAEERECYVEELCKKIRDKREQAKGYRVISVFVGGGTPSVLEGSQMERIFESLYQTFQIDESAEITLEMNPGTVTEEKLRCYKRAGINRLSIGLQSVNNEELKMLGRIHTFEEFLETYRRARKEGFANINVDLISAIPGQTVSSWERTLKTVAELQPEHISAYSLIIEEGTPFYEKYHEDPEQELPDEDAERMMYERTEKLLKNYGYHRYEISNYAKKGRECEHNLGYWHRVEYLGFGPSAASFMNHCRWVEGEEPEHLCMEEEMEEFMFLGLRTVNGVSKTEFEETFGKTMDSVYGEVLRNLLQENLLMVKEDRVCPTAKGLDLNNYVAASFLL